MLHIPVYLIMTLHKKINKCRLCYGKGMYYTVLRLQYHVKLFYSVYHYSSRQHFLKVIKQKSDLLLSPNSMSLHNDVLIKRRSCGKYPIYSLFPVWLSSMCKLI